MLEVNREAEGLSYRLSPVIPDYLVDTSSRGGRYGPTTPTGPSLYEIVSPYFPN